MVLNPKTREQIEVLWDQQQALRSHQNWGARKMGKGRTPGDSKASTRDNQHQARRTCASAGTTSGVSRACRAEEGADRGVRLWLWVPAVSAKSLSRVPAQLGRVPTLRCQLTDTRQDMQTSPSGKDEGITYPFPGIRARPTPQPGEVRNNNAI